MKTLIKMFWIFIIGSFIGCIIEHIWCFIKNACFMIRRSFLYLPLIPIYGFAALFMLYFAEFVGYEFWKTFLIGVVVSSIVEYVCSFIQEKVFKTKSWDYTDFKFNLNGRINLVYSLGFGFIGVFVVRIIKECSLYVDKMYNSNIFLIITMVLFILFIIDAILSSIACIRYSKRKQGIDASNIIDKFLDKKYPDSVIEKVYNNSVYVG